MKKQAPLVLMKAATWTRESHGLFDYESQHISKRNLKASSTVKIVRIKNDIHLINNLVNEKKLINENSKILACLKKFDDSFVLTRSDPDSQSSSEQNSAENLWLVAKSVKNSTGKKGYKLREGDIIKLGRMIFRVRELVNKCLSKDEQQFKDLAFSELTINNEDYGDNSFQESQRVVKVNLSDNHVENQCRICLLQETASDDVLVAPCGCSGSVRMVHLNCLQTWIRSKCITKVNNNCSIYHWKNTDCEVCHKSLPDSFLMAEMTKIHLFDHPKPEGSNYIVLESFSKDKDKSKTFYVINTSDAKEPVKLGRGHECDVRIGDISISRLHAFIRSSFGNYYLEDNSSKFGTLVLIKSHIVLDPDFNPAIQIGRTVMSFTLKANPQASSNIAASKEKDEVLAEQGTAKMNPMINIFKDLQIDAKNQNNSPNDESEANQAPTVNESEDDKQPDSSFCFFPNFQVPEKDKPSQGSWQEAFEMKPYLFSRMNLSEESQNRPPNRNNSGEKTGSNRFIDYEEILEEFTAKKQF